MAQTPPVYVFYPLGYPTTITNVPPVQDGQLSLLIIIFIVFAAVIAFFILICLIVVIYNFCAYGTCCPPSGNAFCCRPVVEKPAIQPIPFICCCPPAGSCFCCQPVVQKSAVVEVIRPVPVIQSVRSSPYAVGSYVSRGRRLNQTAYIAQPAVHTGTLSLSAGRLMSRRNSMTVVGQGTIRRASVIGRQSVRRPQIVLSADRYSAPGGTVRNIGQSFIALPSSSSSEIRCFARNDPVTSANVDDDDDIRVIVRNQPYSSSHRQAIVDTGFDVASSLSPPPPFESLSMYNVGGSGGGGGCGGCGGGGGGGMGLGDSVGYGINDTNCNCTYGFEGQQSATVDVSFDQMPTYSFADGGQQFQQASIYPDLGKRSNCY